MNEVTTSPTLDCLYTICMLVLTVSIIGKQNTIHKRTGKTIQRVHKQEHKRQSTLPSACHINKRRIYLSFSLQADCLD